MQKLRAEQDLRDLEASHQVLLRRNALEIEKERSAEVVSRPPPPPDPVEKVELPKGERHREYCGP